MLVATVAFIILMSILFDYASSQMSSMSVVVSQIIKINALPWFVIILSIANIIISGFAISVRKKAQAIPAALYQ